MFRFTALLLLFFATAYSLYAQDTLRGQVIDDDGKPVMAAHVYFTFAPQQGTFTNPQGQFALTVPPEANNRDTLLTTAMGFGESRILYPGHTDTLTIRMRPSEYVLSAVMVQAQDPISEAFLLTRQEQLDIYLNPVAAADPLRSLIALPASTNTSESANPELRGSSADRSRVLVNGVPVYRPVRNTQINGIGNFSLFNTELLESQYVYPTNAPLTRGNSTAGAVAIETIQELTDNYTQLSLGLANAGILRGQRLGEKNFLQAYANRQFSDLFIGLNGNKIQDLQAFQSQDAGLNLHLQNDQGWTLDLFGYGIDEAYDVRINILGETGPVTSQRQRHFNTLRLRKRYGKGSISLHHGFDVSRTDFTFGNTDSRQQQRTWYTALDWRRRINDRWEWQTGIVHEHQRFRFQDQVPAVWYQNAPTDPVIEENDTLAVRRLESYRYVRFRPDDDWLLQAGLRVSWLQQDYGRYVSGQISARRQLTGEQALLLSTGYYHSFSIPTSFDKNIRLLNSWQAALDYDLVTTKDFHLHLAAYLKRESGLYDQLQDVVEDQRWIYGLEMLLEQPFTERLSGSVSATWLQQQVQGNGISWPGEQDQLLLVKALLQYRQADLFDIGLNYIAHNGLWTTQLMPPGEPGGVPTFPSTPNNLRLKPYGSLNLSISRYFPWGDQSLVVFINANNLLDQGNEADLQYDSQFNAVGRQYFQRRSFYGGVVLRL